MGKNDKLLAIADVKLRTRNARSIAFMGSNDEVERRGASPTTNEADLSRSSIHSLAHRSRSPAIARTDC